MVMPLLLLLSSLVHAQTYTVKDEGDFQPQGHPVEFHDRFGWKRYEVRFDFGLEDEGRALSRGSKLAVRIFKREGGSWGFSCKAKKTLSANINQVMGQGLSIVAECPIAEKAFAKAVGLHQEDVGVPALVFQVLVKDGQAVPGPQRGVAFQSAASVEASELKAYVASEDPARLAVVFKSN